MYAPNGNLAVTHNGCKTSLDWLCAVKTHSILKNTKPILKKLGNNWRHCR